MTDAFEARKLLVNELHAELVGPAPAGTALDCSGDLSFATYEAASGPFVQAGSGEEILTGDRPVKRYGVGVLYPTGLRTEAEPGMTASEEQDLDALAAEAEKEEAGALDGIGSRKGRAGDGAEDDDLPLSTANSLRPSSFGLSFVARPADGDVLIAHMRGATYEPKNVGIAERARGKTFWLRRPFEVEARFTRNQLLAKRANLRPEAIEPSDLGNLKLRVAALTRPQPGGTTLLTVSVVNESAADKPDRTAVFQAELECRFSSNRGAICPYEEPQRVGEDDEIAALALLYRDLPAFAIGHGSSADWTAPEGNAEASSVRTAALPRVEVPSTTPDIAGPDGNVIKVPMAPLAGLDSDDDGGDSLQAIIDGYSGWIAQQHARIPSLPEQHRDTALDHLRECTAARDRMQDGIAFLASDQTAAEAFRLANYAMLLQQQRGGHPLRTTVYDRAKQQVVVEGTFTPQTSGRGSWRPFQIAFMLASLHSTAEKAAEDRETVELIFFPTGGGKTEAYLGLTAFSIFYRRLTDPSDTGVDVVMRYTLRLLTAQQFQRASSLICAMDYLRRQNHGRLGDDPIAIGVWLGGEVTPNWRSRAIVTLNQMKKGKAEENPFVMLRCPWCAAQMGPISASGKGKKEADVKVAGYKRREEDVVLHCPDRTCHFKAALPIHVIDEDVYERRPSLVIGTVDKFAMLAFRPEARSLFGLGPDGTRDASPPNLIIQDELHLISGPLGSMVGLYETLIEELCTDRRDAPVKPKIIGSTATIRRYRKQINDLYSRPKSALFPPRGLDASDSYFACYARDGDGRLSPGRVYVGVHGSGLGSVQTAQVRTFASLLQGAAQLEPAVQDPYWTLLVFFNSLRELGTSLSLLQSDIPDYLRVIKKRYGLERMRGLWRTEELTGRLRNDEIPRALEKLEVRRSEDGGPAVDVCLASNIVEVGVDIDRLSLMTVVGQPKTTSQYIQATGRVGRRWWERPGLIVTIYGASKPRDRSHFEKFRSYHERLYAQVEPTSVTPFAPPVLDRALHAVMVAYVRQLGQQDGGPSPVPEELLDSVRDLLTARVMAVDDREAEHFAEVFGKRLGQWRRWEYDAWQADANDEDFGFLRYAGAYATKDAENLSWAIPTSLRNVDAECRAYITNAYRHQDERET